MIICLCGLTLGITSYRSRKLDNKILNEANERLMKENYELIQTLQNNRIFDPCEIRPLLIQLYRCIEHEDAVHNKDGGA